MRYITSGESHGRALTAIVLGMPAGVPISQTDIDNDLARRQSGYGRGGRMKIESDRGLLLSGVRFGRTIGSPVTVTIANKDWENWTDVMASSGKDAGRARITAPRPGHADLSGMLKTRSTDARDILERASARETAARVAAGAIAKSLLGEFGVRVRSWVFSIGDVAVPLVGDPAAVDFDAAESSDVSCPDEVTAEAMRRAIDAARDAGESLGGTFFVVADGLVPGLGTYAEAGGRLDARFSSAVVSIPAIKGVEFGDGFAAAARPGSLVHDEIVLDPQRGYSRRTNRAGGIEGGMSNGEPIVIRAAMKPIPTLMTPLQTVDTDTGQPVEASTERSDVCAVPAAAVVAEAEVAMVLADAYLDAFGGNNLEDILAALDAYRTRVRP